MIISFDWAGKCIVNTWGFLKLLYLTTDYISSLSLFPKNCSFILFHPKKTQITEQADTLSDAIHFAVAVCLSDLFVAVSHTRQLVQLQFLTATFQESMMNLHGNSYGSRCWAFAQSNRQSSSSWKQLLRVQLVYCFTEEFVCLFLSIGYL